VFEWKLINKDFSDIAIKIGVIVNLFKYGGPKKGLFKGWQ